MFEASDLPAEVRACLPDSFELVAPPQGETSQVAFARTANADDIVIKRTSGALYSQWLERESKVLDALAGTGLSVPRVLGEHTSGDVHWLLMSRMPGESGWNVIVQACPERRKELLRGLGSTLAKIHATPVPAALHDADSTPWLERHRLFAAEISFEDELIETFGAPPPGLRTLIHGDFTLDNVLFSEDRVCGVIDWSGCGAGDPRFDIALALATSPELVMSPGELSAFFSGYVHDELPASLRAMVRELYGYSG